MLQLDKFLDQDESIYHRPRRVIPWHVLAWGLTLLGLHGGASGEDKLPLGQFVLLSNVEVSTKCPQDLLALYLNPTGSGRTGAKTDVRPR